MVSPLLFEALGCEVFLKDTAKMEHILLTRWADVLLLCPATASTIGKIANGIGGGLILDLFLARPKGLRTIIAPAMNGEMWENAFVKENLQKLENHGFEVVTPQSGELACGEVGVGKLADVEEIAGVVLKREDALNVLITAGGTIEKLDDVRCLTNFSSGKMALELVRAFAGHNVVVVVARAEALFPSWCKIVKVESAKDMLKACIENVEGCDVFFGCAAVADFTFEARLGKVKKGEIKSLNLIPNPDVLKTVANVGNRPRCVVGFAAEAENLRQNANGKLQAKNCDFIVGNSLVFGREKTSGVILGNGNIEEEFDCLKKELAGKIKAMVLKFLNNKGVEGSN
jgi:phosphopantothenoylcysteine decarboxylase/phosphopantothenate--cysteine ligase